MSTNDKKSQVFSCFKKVKDEFLPRSHTIVVHTYEAQNYLVWNYRIFGTIRRTGL